MKEHQNRPRSTCATPPAAPANRSFNVRDRLPTSASDSSIAVSVIWPFQLWEKSTDIGAEVRGKHGDLFSTKGLD